MENQHVEDGHCRHCGSKVDESGYSLSLEAPDEAEVEKGAPFDEQLPDIDFAEALEGA